MQSIKLAITIILARMKLLIRHKNTSQSSLSSCVDSFEEESNNKNKRKQENFNNRISNISP
jgi:hypothetical protein